MTRLIDEQCRKIHAQYHFIKPLNDLLNYSLVFTNIYKCDGFCVIDDNRVSWNARSEDRVLNTYPKIDVKEEQDTNLHLSMLRSKPP